jgi:hypothetical protein
MASLQSAAAAAPSPAGGKGYDPEIKDIADYVHNKPIDSELAVRRELFLCRLPSSVVANRPWPPALAWSFTPQKKKKNTSNRG